MNLAPIVFIGFIVFFIAISTRVRKQAEEARRANQRREEAQRQNAAASSMAASVQTPAAAPSKQAAASPRVQPQTTVRVKTTAASVRPAVQKQQELKPGAEARPPVKTDAAPSARVKAGKPETQNKQTLGEAKNPIVQWNRDSALQGIILAEILGKPKALRNK